MKYSIRVFFVLLRPINAFVCYAQQRKPYDAICSGIHWFDNDGNNVSAHGAGIINERGW